MQQVLEVETDRPHFALSFDDGPDPWLTPQLLKVLRRFDARATFFVIGEKALRHPHLMRELVAQGHEVANHSYSHPYMIRQTSGTILTEVDRAQNAIFDTCGVEPRLFRAPHGRLARAQREMLAYNRDLTLTYWSVDPKDWRDQDAQLIAERLETGVTAGAIALLHDVLACSLAACETALAEIRRRGLTSIPVSALLAEGKVRYVGDSPPSPVGVVAGGASR